MIVLHEVLHEIYIGTSWSINLTALGWTGNINRWTTSWTAVSLIPGSPWAYTFWNRIGVKYDTTTVYFYINWVLKTQITHPYWSNVRPVFLLRDNTNSIKIYYAADMLYSY